VAFALSPASPHDTTASFNVYHIPASKGRLFGLILSNCPKILWGYHQAALSAGGKM